MRINNLLIAFLLMLAASLSLPSCLVYNKDSPQEVAIDFLTAIQAHDWEKAKELSTETTQRDLDVLAQLPGSPQYNSVNIVKEDVEGDRASVIYYFSAKETEGEEAAESKEREELVLDMIRKDRKWLVETNKQAMMGSDAKEDDLLQAQLDKATKGLEEEIKQEIRKLEAQQDSLNPDLD